MKKTGLLATLLISAMLLSSRAKAQSTTDYFPGKWKVTIYGTPNGDAFMYFLLQRKDGKLTGTVNDSTDKEMTKITQIEEKDTTVTLYFTTQGYDVNINLNQVPADSVKGSLMGMFDAKGVRIKPKS